MYRIDMNDEIRLQSLGYKQELTRSLSRLTNYGMTLTAVSIGSAVTSLFGYGLKVGGPVVMVWGWIVVAFFNLCISLGMAEICSAFPTAGGLYYWTAILVPERYKAMVSWFTRWFNLMGQFAAVALSDFGLSMLIASIISIGVGEWSPLPWHLVMIHFGLIISHGVCNSLGRRALLWFTHVSTCWQLLTPIIVGIALLANVRDSHEAAHYAFTTYANRTGWSSVVYVSLISLLMAQSCLGGYDSAAHMCEETKRADVGGPFGMIGALVGSSLLGWFFIIALLMGIKDYETTVETPTGYPVTQILLDNFGRSWTIVLMCLPLIAGWFCGLISVTATSRLMYAFSRDHAMPFSHIWHAVHPRLSCPVYGVWLSCLIGFLLALPYLVNSTAFYAILSLYSISMNIAYGLPLLCKVLSSIPFSRGPFHLGRFSTYIDIIGITWVIISIVLFVLPTEYPVTATNMNYTSLVFGAAVLAISLTFIFSARYWFKGPLTNLSTTIEPK